MKTIPSPLDLRVPNITQVPKGSYLITGLPRIRSAWLAALLSVEHLPCFHEAPTDRMPPIARKSLFGLSDPGAACLYPVKALALFDESTIVIIERPIADSRRALEKLAGGPATNWDQIELRYRFFVEHAKNAIRVKYKDLNDFDTVADLYRRLTYGRLSAERFEIFQGLRIEQDIVKRARAEAA